MSIAVGIEGFTETKKAKQEARNAREVLCRKSFTVGRKVLDGLHSINKTKNTSMQGYDAVKTPTFKVAAGYGDKKICLQGMTGSPGTEYGAPYNDLELVVKAGGKKHVYATIVKDGNIEYARDLGFKPSQDNLVWMDEEVSRIIDSISQAAQEEYCIEV